MCRALCGQGTICDLDGGRQPAVGGLIKYDRYLPYGLLIVRIYQPLVDRIERTIGCRQ